MLTAFDYYQAMDEQRARHSNPYIDDVGARKSKFFAASSLEGVPIKSREWAVQDLVPSGTVTLLGGDGGTGKSLLALQLAFAIATGGRWLGHQTVSGPVMFISAEDDQDELHRRTADIVRAAGMQFNDVERLTLRSLAGEDALLAVLDRSSGVLTPTPLHAEIEARIAVDKPALIVLDTLADLFPGNENDRAQARQFIGLLRGWAIRHSCAIILLAHPSLSGLTSGSGTSGSTGWNNSVRSRLYLERIAQDGYEANPDARVLRTMKANYGRTGGEITMTWKDGVFVPDAAETGLDRMALDNRAERVFLRLLDDFTKQGRFVKSAQAQGYAPKVFAASGSAEGLSKQALHKAMERLFAKGEIVEILGGHMSPSKQTKRIARVSAATCATHAGGC